VREGGGDAKLLLLGVRAPRLQVTITAYGSGYINDSGFLPILVLGVDTNSNGVLEEFEILKAGSGGCHAPPPPPPRQKQF